jgi:hypothetical protein
MDSYNNSMKNSHYQGAVYTNALHTPKKNIRNDITKLTPQKIKHNRSKRNQYTQTHRRGLSKNQYAYNDSLQHVITKLTPQKIKHIRSKRNRYTQTHRRGLSKNQYAYNDSLQHVITKLTPQKIKHIRSKKNGRNA